MERKNGPKKDPNDRILQRFALFIKSFNAEFTKLTGFWYSIDNIKDIKAINNKKTLKNKYMNLRKIKNQLLT